MNITSFVVSDMPAVARNHRNRSCSNELRRNDVQRETHMRKAWGTTPLATRFGRTSCHPTNWLKTTAQDTRMGT